MRINFISNFKWSLATTNYLFPRLVFLSQNMVSFEAFSYLKGTKSFTTWNRVLYSVYIYSSFCQIEQFARAGPIWRRGRVCTIRPKPWNPLNYGILYIGYFCVRTASFLKKKGFSGGPRPPFGIFWMSGWTQGSRPAISSNRRQVSRNSPGFFRVGSGRFARFDAHPGVSTRRYF